MDKSLSTDFPLSVELQTILNCHDSLHLAFMNLLKVSAFFSSTFMMAAFGFCWRWNCLFKLSLLKGAHHSSEFILPLFLENSALWWAQKSYHFADLPAFSHCYGRSDILLWLSTNWIEIDLLGKVEGFSFKKSISLVDTGTLKLSSSSLVSFIFH